MEERLVDVLNDKNNLLHVFPVTVEKPDARPTDFRLRTGGIEGCHSGRNSSRNRRRKIADAPAREVEAAS